MNPFSSDIVKKPREIENSVPGLNDKPLAQLIEQFEILEKIVHEKKKNPYTYVLAQLDHVQFITSTDAGYGKSHLLGRLFKQLSGRANLINIAPFMDAPTAWKSILNHVVQEMSFPERFDDPFNSPKQISIFAHGVLSQLFIYRLKRKRPNNYQQIINYLTKTPFDQLSKDIIKKIQDSKHTLCEELHSLSINPFFSIDTWVNVLITFAYHYGDYHQVKVCNEWIKCNYVEPEEAKNIGIQQADITSHEINLASFNSKCKNMIYDLCLLAGLYRPFVFCFDQTENYGSDPELSSALGMMIRTLPDDFQNCMIILTTNQIPWNKSIKPHWDKAYLDALGSNINLEGINFSQGKEFIRLRLNSIQVDSDQVRKLLDENWLNSIFVQSTINIRHFIRECKKRWNHSADTTDVTIKSLEELFTEYQRTIQSTPQRLQYNRDAFIWFIKEMPSTGCDNIQTLSNNIKYFRLSLIQNGKTHYFGFPDTDNWSTWNAIANRCITMHRQQICGNLIRIFNQTEIPKRTWKKLENINQAKTLGSFAVHALDKETMIKIYAGYDLHKDAVSQNVDYSPDQVKQFLAQPFAEIWESILHSKPGKDQAPNTNALEKKIKKIVSRERFMSLSELLKQLSGTPERLVIDMQNKIPELNIYRQTDMSVVVWSR